MKIIRLLLLPFSLIYGSIGAVRNFFYDNGIFATYTIPTKSICVGNLSVGGTGKTPHVDLIAQHFISKQVSTAILSRGYGRKTQGVLEVNTDSTAENVGDEPLSYKLRHRDSITAVVAEKRKFGVEFILQKHPKTQLIILDDAFQHRAVKAGLNILITDYSDLFSTDFVLPAGNLREFRCGKNRADYIIVSKCPANVSESEKRKIVNQLKVRRDKVFFSKIVYGDLFPFFKGQSRAIKKVLLVTGIGNPKPLLEQLNKTYSVEHIKFSDHHHFTSADIDQIHQKFDTFAREDGIIVTTEKDFMRLKDMTEIRSEKYHWYYQSITTKIDEQEKFNLLLENYVDKI